MALAENSCGLGPGVAGAGETWAGPPGQSLRRDVYDRGRAFKMAEFVTCSQNSVVFWDCKSFAVKRSAQPFIGSDYHVASVSWSASSILRLAHVYIIHIRCEWAKGTLYMCHVIS